jgi:hypothetical protein
MLLPYVVMKFYCFYLSDGEAAISSFWTPST